MGSEDQIEVMADLPQNVLRLSFVGRISASVMVRHEGEIVRVLRSLPPGFSLLTDYTDMTSMDLDCVPYIDRNMDSFRDSGVALVVRIIPDRAKDIGLGIMSRFHYPPGLKIITTDTRDEAERVFR